MRMLCGEQEQDSDRLDLIPNPNTGCLRKQRSASSIREGSSGTDDGSQTESDADSEEDDQLDLDENAFSEFELYKSFCPRVVLRRYENRAEMPTDMEIDYFMAVSGTRCSLGLDVLSVLSVSGCAIRGHKRIHCS
jgi:hypothetical protein